MTHHSWEDISAETIRNAAAGNRAAQQAVLEVSYDFVRKMLYRLVGPGDDLEDLQQEVLVNILTGLAKFKGKSVLSTWVGGICINVARSHLRRIRSRTFVPTAIDDQSLPHLDAEASLEARDMLQRCVLALQELSPNQRIAFVLRTVYHYSIQEIAETMQAHQSTTRLRLYYARKAFAKSIASTAAPGELVSSEAEAK